MAIYRLISNGSFGPDEIKVMTAAYEAALTTWPLRTETIQLRNLSQGAIVKLPRPERDSTLTKERALNALGVRRPAA